MDSPNRGIGRLYLCDAGIQLRHLRSAEERDRLWAHFQGGDVEKGLAELEKQANVMIDDLLWWTAALKTARER